MKRDLASIYSAEWFEHDFRDLGPEFRLAARGIDRWGREKLRPLRGAPTLLDVGCGPGMLLDALYERGWLGTGFDGSPHALAMAERLREARSLETGLLLHLWPRIDRCDILDAPGFGAVDVVVCTEVAEHLPAEHAPGLVRYLTASALRYVVFTAAPPGQGGHDHINEQRKEYWVELFQREGWIVDDESGDELQDRWAYLSRLSHMARNVMVFR